jgi:hypothetical protein
VGGRIIVQQEKNTENRTQLDEPVGCASGGDSLILYKILHLLFSPPVRILCALPQFKSILDRRHSHHLLPALFRFEIENTAKEVLSVQNLISIRLLHQYKRFCRR